MTDAPSSSEPIETLCSAVVSTARGVRGRSLFLGWSTDGLPAAATSLGELSDTARRALNTYRGSGLTPRKVPYAAVVPVTYVLTGPAVDFADTAQRRAEDQVRYTVIDASGKRRDVALGERGVLGAIGASRSPWQAFGKQAQGAELAVSAVPLFTLFAPLPGASVDTGLAMLFDPTIRGETNEPAFRSFVRNTVGRLLVLDESQPAGSRKGYLEIAGRVAGTPPKGGSLRTLVWMRRVGLVDFDDQWLQRMSQSRRRMEGRFIRGLRALRLVEVDDETLGELTDPRPDYDVDQLEMDQLIDMAEQMYRLSRKRLG